MIRAAVQRLTAPVLDRIPDFSAAPPRRQATIGLLASIAVHLLLFLFLVVGVWLTPQRVGVQDGQPQEEIPLEIEVVPLPKTEPERLTLPEPKARELMLSEGLTKSEEKPEKPEFESDQDMKAGSELPASGLIPLPSQEGRTDRNHRSFTEQDVIISLNTAPAAPEAPPAPQGNASPRPMYQPKPLSQQQLDEANEADPEAKLPTPADTPPPLPGEAALAKTPAPSRDVPIPTEDELAISAAKPAAPKADPNRPSAVPAPITRPPQEMAKLTPPAPQQALETYREQKEKTQIEGSISNRGRPGVNAVGTPLGLYVKNVSTIVGSRWNFKVKEQMEWLSAGSVRIRFTVDRQGRIGNIEVLANNSNRAFADLCAQVIRDSKLDPLPPEITEHLQDERLEIPFTFTLYPSH